MIDRFAEATGDHQFIHVDPGRAAETPLGGTVAHGFLILSLIPHLQAELATTPPDVRLGLNYGIDRLRFLRPVQAGSLIRLACTLSSIEERPPDARQLRFSIAIELEDGGKPALVTDWIIRHQLAQGQDA